MFEEDKSLKEVFIFSDEAGHENKDFLAYGLLLFEKKDFNELMRQINKGIIKHYCEKQVLYKDLSGHLKSSRFRCAVDWLKMANSRMPIRFYYNEVDLQHKKFEAHRFGLGHHLYHFFYKMSINFLLRRFYKGQRIKVTIVVHQRSNSKEVENDPYNKLEYLKRFILSSEADVIDVKTVEMSCDHIIEDNTSYARILQFVDIFLGSTYNAIHQKSNKGGKLEVSQMASYIFQTNNNYQARCSYSRFPDERGYFKPIGCMKINPLMYDAPGTNRTLADFS